MPQRSNGAPIILAHGIAPFDIVFKSLRKTLGNPLPPEAAHWFDANIGNPLTYFREIRPALEREGFTTYVTDVGFAAGVEQRARDLQREVMRILGDGGNYEKVNIIAHSMGGLDARYMIAKLGMADRVASLVTIGTPHFGTSFADWGVGDLWLPSHLIDWLKPAGADLSGFRDLTRPKCAAFNAENVSREAANSVVYITYAASQSLDHVFPPLHFSWGIIDQHEGSNDGLVPVVSQRWRAELEGPKGVKRVEQRVFPVRGDHLNEIGWWHPWVGPGEGREAYEAAVQDLYVQIAVELRQRGLYR